MANRVLFIDDQLEEWEDLLRNGLKSYDFDLKGISDPSKALKTIASYKPDVVMLDILFPDGYRGKALLKEIKEKTPHLPVMMITSTMDKSEYRPRDYALAEYRYSKAALVDGDFADLAAVLKRLVNQGNTSSKVKTTDFASSKYGFIVGTTKKMNELAEQIDKIANQDLTVLITGESGVGKKLIAQAIHNLSKRSDGSFVTVVCAALPQELIESELFGHEKGAFTGAVAQKKGKFEVAGEGTIFLDEIGELPLETQVKLLHFLQEKQFERLGGNQVFTSEARIIAATNRDLKALVKEGRFREDLFFRLNVVSLNVPLLRERKEDIDLLFSYFVKKAATASSKKILPILREDVRNILTAYAWPGNIREFQNMIDRAVAFADENILQISNFPEISDRGAKNISLATDVSSIVELIFKKRTSWKQIKEEYAAKGDLRKGILIGVIDRWTKEHGQRPKSQDLASLLKITDSNMRRILSESGIKLIT